MKRIILILVACTLLAAGCKKDTQPPAQWPDTVGNKWIYKHTSGAVTDSIEVEITGTQALPGAGICQVWVYRYTGQGLTDTIYEVKTSDNIRFFYSGHYLLASYKLPMRGGDINTLPICGGDTTRIAAGMTAINESRSYNGCYRGIHVQDYCINSYANDTMWYKDGIGMVRKLQHSYNMGPLSGNGTWELQSYHLVQ